MSTITTKDRTEICCKGWGWGQSVVISHGRWRQPRNGSEMDTFADDLSEFIETLDANGIALVGYLIGGGEVTRYVGRHGAKGVAKFVMVCVATPLAETVTRGKRK